MLAIWSFLFFCIFPFNFEGFMSLYIEFPNYTEGQECEIEDREHKDKVK